ncbi:Ecp1 [Fulvia fulva]|uniref:ECP1 n=1 Tax=Passalora fulva TaxID=5499 RepID=Q00364_PASFU|nr:Ecp1 [Fulvia fulva]KAK4610294.1 Ecp1 [Fulvia fulva]KAK4611138.1 Ecp1 [Fulvia fulva]QDX18247.1 ECP1 protein [Fulvia fulva]QDX18248.1 ECP1 protein [Fulvia fulva]QDX18249.1 ECP1 protein [Fulvia fulva]
MHFVTSLIAGVAMLATASATVQGGAPVDDLKFAKKFNQNCQQISGGPNGAICPDGDLYWCKDGRAIFCQTCQTGCTADENGKVGYCNEGPTNPKCL